MQIRERNQDIPFSDSGRNKPIPHIRTLRFEVSLPQEVACPHHICDPQRSHHKAIPHPVNPNFW